MSTVNVMMIDCEVLMYFDQISNRRFLSVSLLQNCYFPPSWAPQARSEAWEVYQWELYPPDDPPRPSRPKAGLGLVMMMMILMVMMMTLTRWRVQLLQSSHSDLDIYLCAPSMCLWFIYIAIFFMCFHPMLLPNFVLILCVSVWLYLFVPAFLPHGWQRRLGELQGL